MKTPRESLQDVIGNHILPCDCMCCVKDGRVDSALTELDTYYKQKYLGMLPEKKDPLNNLPIDNYIRKFNEGHNSCLDTIRQRMEEN